MSLLGLYLPPEPPAIVALIQAESQAAVAQEHQRPILPSKSDYERYADNVVNGLALLLAEAHDKGIDFETIIHDISLAEKHLAGAMQQLRERAEHQLRGIPKLKKNLRRTAALPPGLRQAVSNLNWFLAVTQRVLDGYQDGRRKLEAIRDIRLAAYATEWESYLAKLEKTTSVADKVRRVWSHLKPRLWAPEASPTDDGDFIMVWDRGPHHLQVRILASGLYDWFYRNRETNEVHFEEDLVLESQYSNLDAIVSRIA
jgi:hypothetical protein